MDPREAAFYQQLDPTAPLEADDTQRYVDWQKMLNADDLKHNLARGLALSGSVPVCRFVTGHRGVGKTTELKRVQHLLESGEVDGQRRFVCFLESERWLDLDDVRAEDVVFQIGRQIVDDLHRRAGIGLGKEKFAAFAGELAAILNQSVNLTSIKLNLGVAELETAIKENPLARTELRRILQGRLPTIYDLINRDILAPARRQLQERDYTEIMVIVDELDRMQPKLLHESGLTNQEELFLSNSRVLRFLACHLVYTVPWDLAFGTKRLALDLAYGAQVLPVPLIPVIGRDGKPSPGGLGVLRELLRRRAEAAGLSLSEIFRPPELLDRVLLISGGYIRLLFLLVRSAMDRSDSLPIAGQAVERTLGVLAQSIAKPLDAKGWEILEAVHRTHQKVEADPSLWNALVRDLYVFSYSLAGDDWYDWNPLLEEVKSRSASPRSPVIEN